MIDEVKRTTLKRIGLSAASVAAAGLTTRALADSGVELVSDAPLNQSLPLADIQVSTRVSAITNDLEVLVKNVGQSSTTITQMTPSVTVTKRGYFDFGALLEDGDIALSPGQYVSVPIQAHPVSVNATDTATGQARPLTEALRRSFSVITDGDAFAKVDITDGLKFV